MQHPGRTKANPSGEERRERDRLSNGQRGGSKKKTEMDRVDHVEEKLNGQLFCLA